MIICGGNYTVIQNEKNEIYVCGCNYYGQLGLGDTKDRGEFEKIEYDFGQIKKIACGGYHTIIQNEKNEIYACGWNYFGQLWLGDRDNRNEFEKVEYEFGEIKNVVCGERYTIIQNEKNEIYVCGDNYCGQCQYNIEEIKNIVCGGYHMIIQNEKNEIYVCGWNEYGQLGLGGKKHRYKFEKVEYDFGEIKNIACGKFHTIIQNEKNEIYVCGYNGWGQLGLGDNKDRDKFEKVEYDFGKIKNIACGGLYTIIQNEKNEIYVCGYNMHGQLGLGDNKFINLFKKIDFDFGKIKNIKCGLHHTIIQNEKNEIYVCGSNRDSQLGLGDNMDRDIFEKVNVDDIFERIYNFELGLNTEEIDL